VGTDGTVVVSPPATCTVQVLVLTKRTHRPSFGSRRTRATGGDDEMTFVKVGRSLLLGCACAGAVRAGAGQPPGPPGTAAPIEAAAAPGGPTGAGGPLTLDTLERIAVDQNPTLAQARDRLEQAYGRAVQAGAYPNPLLIWNASSLGDEGTAGTQQGYVQQPIVIGGKLRVDRARFEVEAESARVAVSQEEMLVRNGVRMRFLQVVSQQEQLDLRAGLNRLADEVVAATREKVGTGHASEADLLTAENEAEQMKLDFEQLRQRYVNTWREFAAFLGTPDMSPVPLAGRLDGETPERDWARDLDRLLQESPELRIAALQVRRAELTLDRARREPIPDLIVRAGAGHDPVSGQTTGYTRVYVEFPIWDRNRGNIRTARGGLDELSRDVGRVRLNLQQRLARDFNHYQTSLVNVGRYRDSILPRARRAFDLYYKSFREEDASFSRVQSSRSAYGMAFIKYLEELLELRRAEVAIEGLELVEESVEVGTLRPPGSGPLRPPGQGLGQAPAGGGVPVGRP